MGRIFPVLDTAVTDLTYSKQIFSDSTVKDQLLVEGTLVALKEEIKTVSKTFQDQTIVDDVFIGGNLVAEGGVEVGDLRINRRLVAENDTTIKSQLVVEGNVKGINNLLVNLLTNSGFGVWSNSTLENVGSQITVTDIANGVCSTANTQGLAVGKLVRFDSGDFNGKVYEVTAVTVNTSFTVHDTSINDSGSPGTCYEATPGCVAADSNAADGHSKISTLDVWRQEADPAHCKGYYGLKLKKGVAGAEYYDLNKVTDRAFIDRFKGRQATFGCWVYDDSGGDDNVKLQIYDGVGTTESSFVTSGGLTWVEITRTIDVVATEMTPRILLDGDAGDIAYVSQVMLVFGSSIGEGNYVQPPGEIVWCQVGINGNVLHGVSGFSDVGETTLNVEADSSGRVPKGAKAVCVMASVKDSGSSGATTWFLLKGIAESNNGVYIELTGVPNGYWRRASGWQPCDNEGDIKYQINASGSGTFDVGTFRYNGVQVS